MTAEDLGELRSRLSTAEADARKALAEAGQIGRLMINGPLGQYAPEAVVAMSDRLAVLRHAMHDLEATHAALRRLVPLPRDAGPNAIAAASPPQSHDEVCVNCRRTDAIVPIRVCMRCSRPGGVGAHHWLTGAEDSPLNRTGIVP